MPRNLFVGYHCRLNKQYPLGVMMGEFAIKVSPFGGSTVGELWEGRMRACGGGWYEPILVGGLTYIGRHRDLYSFVVGSI